MQTTRFDFFHIRCVLEVDLFLSVSRIVVFFLGAFASDKALLWHRAPLEPGAGVCWGLPGGARCSWISFEVYLVYRCYGGGSPSPRIRPLCHVLLTTWISMGFIIPLLSSSRSLTCPRRCGRCAHGGAWAAPGLPRDRGKQRLPFLKEKINRWSSDFWASEGVHSRKIHAHVRMKGPGKLSLGFCNWTKQVSAPCSVGLTKKPK